MEKSPRPQFGVRLREASDYGRCPQAEVQKQFIHFRISLIAIITTDTEIDNLTMCTYNRRKRRR